MILVLFVLSVSGFCEEKKDEGIIVEESKASPYKKIFYLKDGKKVEIKVKGEYFMSPVHLMRSEDGRYIMFFDSIEDNRFDSYLYLHDIKKNKTKNLLMRNIKIGFIERAKWFDSHSFMIKIASIKDINFVIGNFGPFNRGTYIIKFNEDLEMDNMKKVVW
jgi:hypothetical protein